MISISADVAFIFSVMLAIGRIAQGVHNLYLFELQQLSGLHQMFQLKGALWHVMRFAPLLYTGDVVLNLHRCVRVSIVLQEQTE